MRENRMYGSEGREARAFLTPNGDTPVSAPAAALCDINLPSDNGNIVKLQQ